MLYHDFERTSQVLRSSGELRKHVWKDLVELWGNKCWVWLSSSHYHELLFHLQRLTWRSLSSAHQIQCYMSLIKSQVRGYISWLQWMILQIIKKDNVILVVFMNTFWAFKKGMWKIVTEFSFKSFDSFFMAVGQNYKYVSEKLTLVECCRKQVQILVGDSRG